MELNRVGESFTDEMFIGENNPRSINDNASPRTVRDCDTICDRARDAHSCRGYFFYQVCQRVGCPQYWAMCIEYEECRSYGNTEREREERESKNNSIHPLIIDSFLFCKIKS